MAGGTWLVRFDKDRPLGLEVAIAEPEIHLVDHRLGRQPVRVLDVGQIGSVGAGGE